MSNKRASPVKTVLIVVGLTFLPIVAARSNVHSDAWITAQARSAAP
jgi:hypothetical protein